MKVAVLPKSNIKIKVRKEDGRITATDPVTVKNPILKISKLGDIEDVREVNVIDGAILRYNANNQTYDIAPANSLFIQELTTNELTANSLILVEPLDAIYGGTGLNLYTTGDILYAANSTHLLKLNIGAEDTVLTVANGMLQYSNIIDGGFYGL